MKGKKPKHRENEDICDFYKEASLPEPRGQGCSPGADPTAWNCPVCEPCLGRMVSSRSWGQGRKSLQETQSVATRKGKQPDFFLPPVPDLFPGSPTAWICQKPEYRAAWAHTVSMSQPHCIKHRERGTKNGSDIKQAKNDCHHIFSLILGSNPFF